MYGIGGNEGKNYKQMYGIGGNEGKNYKQMYGIGEMRTNPDFCPDLSAFPYISL